MMTIVITAFATTIRAYEVDHACAKSNRDHAFATPLITTAIAVHNASWLKRGKATLRSPSASNVIAQSPPTQSASATTCTTSEPIANACEPAAAEWLWKTGATSPRRVIPRKTIDCSAEVTNLIPTNTIAAAIDCAKRNCPNSTCVINERNVVGSSAGPSEEPRMFARVRLISSKLVTSQIVAAIVPNFRSFSAELCNLPFCSMSKNPKERSTPTKTDAEKMSKDLLTVPKVLMKELA